MDDVAKVGCLLSHASIFFSLDEAQVTYNTALATCLDGAVKSIYVGTKITTDMLEDAETESTCGLKGLRGLLCTKVLAWQLMKQLLD